MINQNKLDINGTIIKVLLYVFIWYSEVIQQRFVHIPNALLILGVALIFMVFIDATSFKNRNVINKFPAAAWMMVVYIIVTFAIGFLVSPQMDLHISHGTLAIELTVIMLVICYYCISRQTLSFLLWNIFIMCIFTAIVFLVHPIVYYDRGLVRYSLSTMMNPNIFAMQLATGMWATLYLASRKRINILVSLILCGVFVYAILLTGSRKGILGAVICIILWILCCYIPLDMHRTSTNKLFRVAIVFVIGGILSVTVLPYIMASTTVQRITDLFVEGGGSRTEMYIKGLEYIKASPLWGHGYWGFAVYYGWYSHATLVEIPVTSGIPLAILYFSSYLNIFKNLWRRYKMKETTQIEYLRTVDIRMAIILMIMMVFYTICVIHIYQTMSFVCFAIIMMAYSIEDNQDYYRESLV